MELSNDFTLKELTETDTGLPNVPDEERKAFLLLLAIFILQPIRNRFGKYTINSSYRSPEISVSDYHSGLPPTAGTVTIPRPVIANFILKIVSGCERVNSKAIPTRVRQSSR